jgi:transcriptional regulator with XRE-family HTH domain
MNKSLGQRIRELRKGCGLTQRKLAEAVGIDFTYLSKIENNTVPYSPSAKTLKKLANELNVDEWELLALAGKLPAGMKDITNTELGIRFLRQASRMRTQDDWEELLAFMQRRDRKENQ